MKGKTVETHNGNRVVKESDAIYKVVCSIERSALYLPIFHCQCFIYDEETKAFETTERIARSSTKITSVVNQVLQVLSVPTSKKWPGPNFFGFALAEVKALQHMRDKRSKPSGH